MSASPSIIVVKIKEHPNLPPNRHENEAPYNPETWARV